MVVYMQPGLAATHGTGNTHCLQPGLGSGRLPCLPGCPAEEGATVPGSAGTKQLGKPMSEVAVL